MSNYFEGRLFREHIVCKSGLRLSIQASERHYSIPKKQNAFSYYACEVAVIGQKRVKALDKYIGHKQDYCNMLGGFCYSSISANTIMKVIVKNGGVSEGELPPLKFERNK